MAVLAALEAFLSPRVEPGDAVVVAFSAGPDSAALLIALTQLAPRLGLRLTAAHLDHQLDADSPRRAELARSLAARLGVPFRCAVRAVAAGRRPGESLEEAARRERYDFLAAAAAELGARWILTAHHRDDQAETLLMRMRQGSGLDGLAGIRPENGRLLRPLLDCSRRELASLAAGSGFETNDDPGNRDLARARNWVRHRLLPHLERADRDLPARLADTARATQNALPSIERRLERRLAPRHDGHAIEVDTVRLCALPASLRGPALALLARRVGARHPPSARAQAEFWRQLESGRRAGCDCGGGWRFGVHGAALRLSRPPAAAGPFTYTFAVPGHCDVAESGWRVRLRPATAAPWMFEGESRRAGLGVELTAGQNVEVRNRRPGDRVHPLGGPGSRRLKEILVDRRMPREERDRLPLLCIGGRIAWVPGVIVAEPFRLAPGKPVWMAEIEEL